MNYSVVKYIVTNNIKIDLRLEKLDESDLLAVFMHGMTIKNQYMNLLMEEINRRKINLLDYEINVERGKFMEYDIPKSWADYQNLLGCLIGPNINHWIYNKNSLIIMKFANMQKYSFSRANNYFSHWYVVNNRLNYIKYLHEVVGLKRTIFNFKKYNVSFYKTVLDVAYEKGYKELCQYIKDYGLAVYA